MTDIDIDAARALCDAATGGTWRALDHEVYTEWTDGKGRKVAGYLDTADAAFIAAARDLVPALLDEVERLRAAEADRFHWECAARDMERGRDKVAAERDEARAAIARVEALCDGLPYCDHGQDCHCDCVGEDTIRAALRGDQP